MEKENVYEQNTQTEAVACATEPTQKAGAEKETSAVLGKFKDVDALIRAYENLQAEFTRRSQKLKQFEKEAEKAAQAKDEAGVHGGVEKLRENAVQRRKQAMEFDKFVADIQTANACAEKQQAENGDGSFDNFTRTGTQQDGVADVQTSAMQTADPKTQINALQTQKTIEQGEVGDGENASIKEKTRVASVDEYAKSVDLSSDELLAKVHANEDVRLRIIGEYLSSVGKTAAPLMQGGMGTLAMPPMKPKSFNDAGNMALRFFKKDGVQA